MLQLSQTHRVTFSSSLFAGVASLSSQCASIVIALTILFFGMYALNKCKILQHVVSVSRHLLFHVQYVCVENATISSLFTIVCKKNYLQQYFMTINFLQYSYPKMFTFYKKEKSKIFSCVCCLISIVVNKMYLLISL